MGYAFDGVAKVITLSPGTVTVEVSDLYSRWIDWLAVSDNMKYQQALRFVGGDAISDTKDLGITFFLINGWRIRPDEANHTLRVNGNIYTDPSGSSVFIPTLGSFNVMVEMTVSSLVDSSLAQMPEIEQASFNSRVAIDVINGTVGTAYPIGTQKTPAKSLADAKLIAAERGFDTFYVIGDLTIGATDVVSAFRFQGQGATLNVYKTTITFTQGCVSSNTHYYNARITGYQGGESNYHDCVIDGIENAHCIYERCGFLDGTTRGYSVKQSSSVSGTHASYYKECFSDEGTMILDRNGARLNVTIDGFSGRLKVINQNHATSSGTIWMHLNGGTVTVDASCTKGKIYITGTGTLVNTSAGTEVDLTGFISESFTATNISIEAIRDTHQGFGARWYVDPINGNDLSPGNSTQSPVRTLTKAIANAVSGRGDVIYLISPNSGTATVAENIVLNKEDTHIRAPGRGIQIQPPVAGVGPVVHITANNCSLDGLLLRTAVNSNDDCVVINAKFIRLEDMYLVGADGGAYPQSQVTTGGVGLHIKGGDYHKIFSCEIEKFGSDGVRFTDAPISSEGSPREVRFDNCNIYYNRGAGVNITGTSANSSRLNIITNSRIHQNSSYGVAIGSNTQRNMVMATNYIKANGAWPEGTGPVSAANEVYVDPAATMGMVDLMPDTLVAGVWNHSVAVSLADRVDIAQAILRNKTVTNPSTGVMTVYADDGVTPLLTANLFENVSATQPYRGQGAERRERLQ